MKCVMQMINSETFLKPIYICADFRTNAQLIEKVDNVPNVQEERRPWL